MSTLNRARPGSREQEDLPRELVTVFGAFGPAYMKWMHAQARDSGVTYARMKTLHALQLDGPQIMSSLGERLGVTARSVTALVDGLEAEELVRRVPHPTDRRATIIELTEVGRRLIHGQYEAHAQHAAELFARLAERDQRELLRIMRSLTQALVEQHGGSCPRDW